MNSNQSDKEKKESANLHRQKVLTVVYAVVFFVGLGYIFGAFDSLSSFLTSPKDYKAEELQNLQALQAQDKVNESKLIDENAQQYVNEPVEEVEEEPQEEVAETPEEEEPEEPQGEVF